IGIFDSGVGGLTVANAILNRLPNERIVYFGDTAHLPYGEKSPSALRAYSEQITEFLLDQDCKMIVVACNSAWSAAQTSLANEFADQVPIINVVDPVVNYVGERGYKKVGLIATRATVTNGIFSDKLRKITSGLKLISKATPLLVHVIEEGYVDDPMGKAVIQQHFQDQPFGDIEAFVLACTHFPVIKKQIGNYFPDSVEIIDASILVADQVAATLKQCHLLSPSKSDKDQYFVSDYTDVFLMTARSFYKHEIEVQLMNLWEAKD
ncbi:UNVERIFIED_CONTAM: hypothetical protein GTU68_034398, partial [Idotea baltica]|nr:hypothetical protein [Idotea baltica]